MKSAGLQQECSKNHRGAQQESSRKPQGIRQGCSRNATNTPRATAGKQEFGRTATGTQQKRQGAQPEPSRKSPGIRQGCATKTTGAAAGTQQEFGRSVAGMQRKQMHGATADTHGDCSRNSAAAGTRQKREGAQQKPSRPSRESSRARQGCTVAGMQQQMRN